MKMLARKHYGDLSDTSNLTRLIRDIEPGIYNLGVSLCCCKF